jgi:pimeloyl-ACP methyl ester carboxylesterase
MNIREVDANGFTFEVREAGERDGESVVLLHGFPETSAMWNELMGSLAEQGYHCIAPDQRGYSPGARPESVDAYRYEDVGGDVHAIAKAVGLDRFHLIGHDWGAGAGWCALAIDENPIASWTAMSVGHYRAFAEAVRDDPEEELYRGFLNGITDQMGAMFTANNGQILRSVWSESSPDEAEAYLNVLGDPAAVDAALNWYRACRLHMRCLDDGSFPFGPVSTPTLFLWGKNDPYVRRASVDGAAAHMIGPYELVELDAGHWLIQEQPDQVRDAILKHLRANAL